MQTKTSREVQRMFHDIAPTYDFLNHLLSFNIDKAWRRFTALKVVTPDVERILDVCSGTGDLAVAFAGRAQELRTSPVIASTDFTQAMTTRAKQKFEREAEQGRAVLQLPIVGDTLHLPFQNCTFDVVSVAFGIRNVQDLRGGIREMARVCRKGGCLAILEFSHPRNVLFRRVYELYFFRILPGVGRLLTRTKAYSYLPRSVAKFPDTDEFTMLLREETDGEVQAHRLTMGIATLYVVKVLR